MLSRQARPPRTIDRPAYRDYQDSVVRGTRSPGPHPAPHSPLGAALVTVPLDPPEARALAMLLARRDGVLHHAQHADDGWGEGPVETGATALADANDANSSQENRVSRG
ncbi:hypothetical protein GCM10027075_61820 [Streptomyces heilongjiangensis]